MFEQEVDSEDDFEGYFLRPVNEYNIVDKIKEANKELFETKQIDETSTTTITEFTSETTSRNLSTTIILQRKVKFREILEDYEPEMNDLETINDDDDDDDSKDVILKISSPIPEDDDDEQQIDEISDFNNKTTTVIDSSDNEIEEICEEIVNVDIIENSGNSLNVHIDKTNEEIQLNNIKIINNSTNNIEEDEKILEIIDLSSPSQSPTKQMIVSSSSEIKRKSSTDDTSLCSRTSDDDLSIIVASYYIDDSNEKFIDDDSHNYHHQKNGVKTKTKSKTKISYQTKQRNTNHDILKLRLNYKTCCEYKNSLDEQLPRYSGYYSQYGLTKEQWEKRENKLEIGRKKFIERKSQLNNENSKKMLDNERAFVNWLKNKMRYPINKTKNMFDLKTTQLNRRSKKNLTK